MAFGSTHSCFLGLIVLVVFSVPLGVHTTSVADWTKNFVSAVQRLSPTITQNVLLNEKAMYKVFISLSGIVQDMYSNRIVEIPHVVVGLGPKPDGIDQFQTDEEIEATNPGTEGVIFYKDVKTMALEMWPSTTGEIAYNLYKAEKSVQDLFSVRRPRAVHGEVPDYCTGSDMLTFQNDLLAIFNHLRAIDPITQLPFYLNHLPAINAITQLPFYSDDGQLSISAEFSPHTKGIKQALRRVPDAVKITFSFTPRSFFSSTTTTTTATVPSTTLPSTTYTTTTSNASKLTVYGVCVASSIFFASVML